MSRPFIFTSRPQIQQAARTLVDDARLLSLSQFEYIDTFSRVITSRIVDNDLLNYATGVRDTHDEVIRHTLCEVVYLVAGEQLTPTQYVNLDDDARKGAHFALKWKGGDGFYGSPKPATETQL
ncbi:hypothetical protein [Pseudomonas sp.]|uniref:hypothetical protein n=1 Tax=Pseudomonas sp. TaxID=306 RepID=UPI003FD74B93